MGSHLVTYTYRTGSHAYLLRWFPLTRFHGSVAVLVLTGWILPFFTRLVTVAVYRLVPAVLHTCLVAWILPTTHHVGFCRGYSSARLRSHALPTVTHLVVDCCQFAQVTLRLVLPPFTRFVGCTHVGLPLHLTGCYHACGSLFAVTLRLHAPTPHLRFLVTVTLRIGSHTVAARLLYARTPSRLRFFAFFWLVAGYHRFCGWLHVCLRAHLCAYVRFLAGCSAYTCRLLRFAVALHGCSYYAFPVTVVASTTALHLPVYTGSRTTRLRLLTVHDTHCVLVYYYSPDTTFYVTVLAFTAPARLRLPPLYHALRFTYLADFRTFTLRVRATHRIYRLVYAFTTRLPRSLPHHGSLLQLYLRLPRGWCYVRLRGCGCHCCHAGSCSYVHLRCGCITVLRVYRGCLRLVTCLPRFTVTTHHTACPVLPHLHCLYAFGYLPRTRFTQFYAHTCAFRTRLPHTPFAGYTLPTQFVPPFRSLPHAVRSTIYLGSLLPVAGLQFYGCRFYHARAPPVLYVRSYRFLHHALPFTLCHVPFYTAFCTPATVCILPVCSVWLHTRIACHGCRSGSRSFLRFWFCYVWFATYTATFTTFTFYTCYGSRYYVRLRVCRLHYYRFALLRLLRLVGCTRLVYRVHCVLHRVYRLLHTVTYLRLLPVGCCHAFATPRLRLPHRYGYLVTTVLRWLLPCGLLRGSVTPLLLLVVAGFCWILLGSLYLPVVTGWICRLYHLYRIYPARLVVRCHLFGFCCGLLPLRRTPAGYFIYSLPQLLPAATAVDSTGLPVTLHIRYHRVPVTLWLRYGLVTCPRLHCYVYTRCLVTAAVRVPG